MTSPTSADPRPVAVGGALDPTRVDGPRLADRKVQVSTYGAAIPILYGGTAGSGNVIWSTDLVEHDVESDGKGGPVTTTHTYSVSCAVLIGEGPIAGIRRIWADAKLVYDAREDADAVTQAASAVMMICALEPKIVFMYCSFIFFLATR